MPQVRVNGSSIAYEERGRGEPLVLLHGWNSSSKQWLMNLKAFAPRFRAIAPDLPGFGDSEECESFPYTRDGMADFVEAFRRALRLPSLHLLGHAMGGCIAVRYAVRYREAVERLVLVSTPTRTASLGLHALLPGARFFTRATYRARNESFLKWMIFRDVYEPENLELGFVRANIQANLCITRKALSESTRLVRRMDLADDLREIPHPTLIVFGDRDRRVNPREAQRQRELLSKPYLAVFTSCAHCPPWERPDLFNQVVLDFLQEEALS